MPSKPESFSLDHNEVQAPYVRKADERYLTYGGTIIKFDVRFTQPNISYLSMPTIHSIEHSLATTLRQHSHHVIDISPMGCQTGFYITVDGDEIPSVEKFISILEPSLKDVLDFETTPGATEKECGFAASHDIKQAQQAIKKFLSYKDEWE